MTAKEKTLVLLKPDAFERELAGEIITRLERKNFRFAAVKLLKMTEPMARAHYPSLADEPFFPEILAYITRGPILAIVLEGHDAVESVRKLVGPTDGSQAPAGTIRGDFTLSFRENLVHASDSAESAKREIALFFDDSELLEAAPDHNI